MRTSVMNMVVAAIACGVLLSVVLAQQPAPDWVLFNGKVFTSNAKQPHAEALAIRGERIVAVGSSQEIRRLAGKDTKQIDLGGRTVIPGINDAHDHLKVFPDAYDLPIQGMDPSWQEVKDALTAAVTKTPKGTWIYGGIGQTILENSQATRAALDALAPDHPVVLVAFTAHSALLNTAAMRKTGIREDEPNPKGGRYVRNKADGMFTGLLLDFAAFRFFCRWSELVTEQQAVKGLHDYFDQAVRMGITTVQDMAMPILAQRVVALFEEDPPPIRVRVIWFGMMDEHGRVTRDGRGLPHHPVPLVTVSGTKWMIDGTPLEDSVAKREPPVDRPSTSDELDFPQEEVEKMLRESLQSDEGLMLHVSGTLAAETVLNAMERTGGEEVWKLRRARFEHGYGLTPDLMRRAKRLGVIVVPNPTHLASRMRSLLDAGIPVAIGSDGPINPYLNI